MNNMKSLPSVARFGAFEVSFELREIRKHGMRIQLEEKPFKILEALIENAGQVVRRQTLCEKLWPDTHVAFDHSLNTAVNKLRSVLGDGAQSPRYIETRPRLGYRFVAPVELVNGAGPVAARTAAASASAGQSPIAAQPQAHRAVIAGPVQHSSRPQRVQA
jgi:DNA-binding winged helix-turn-helix (wHTH) protein